MTYIRIQSQSTVDWRLPERAILVDTSTPWGNPFVVDHHGTREECARWFGLLIFGSVCLSAGPSVATQIAYIGFVMTNIPDLRGHDLACSCPLPERGKPDLCHAAALLAICAKLDEKEAALGRPLTRADWSRRTALEASSQGKSRVRRYRRPRSRLRR